MANKNPKTTLVWRIGGEAGHGINKTGAIFSKTVARQGYYIFDYAEYPSLIRGGHTNYQVTVSNQPVRSTPERANVLVALDDATIKMWASDLMPGGLLIYDPKHIGVDLTPYTHVQCVPISLAEYAVTYGKSELARNSVGLGASLALLGMSLQGLEGVFTDVFGKKGAAVAQANFAAAQAGFTAGRTACGKKKCLFGIPKPRPVPRNMVITGNEAAGVGAIAAGCTFYGAYPMSPSTGILQYMADHGKDYNVVVRQTEDEIAAINMTIGAAFAGARAQTGSSGGGFSLMVEGVGLAGATETPVVIVICSRPGPSTGLPTWTAQADLLFALYNSQGEFPRAIIAPGDATEMFQAEIVAHNLAERYQMPVIILSDNLLAESHQSVPPFDLSTVKIDRGALLSQQAYARLKEYKRYAVTPSGISPRALPHYKGHTFVANSDEHDEYGYSEESSENRVAQEDKRLRKLDLLAKEVPGPTRYGPRDADLTVLAWGSTKGAVLDALDLLGRGARVNFYHYQYLWPFPVKATERIFAKADRVMIVEGNHTGQFAQLLRSATGFTANVHVRKYDGRPFWPDELARKFKECL